MSRRTHRSIVTAAVVVAMLASSARAATEARQTDGDVLHLKVINVSGPAALGGPLNVALTLEVTKDQSVIVPSVLIVGGNVGIEVFDPSGDRLPYRGKKYKLMPFKREQFLSLAPTYHFGRTMNLGEFFSFTTRGKYRVRVSFSNADSGQKHGLSAWTGEVIADEVSIEVEP